MQASLRSILQASNVLFIDKKENIPINIQNSLDIFFSKIYYESDLDLAHDIYLQKSISLVISDIETINNLKLLKMIRKYDYKVALIIVSDTKNYQTILEIIRLQAIDLINKPIKIESFIFALNNTAKHLLKDGNIIVKFNKKYLYNYVNKTVQLDNKIISLTKNESKLLELLLSKEGKIVSKVEIENYIWGEIIVNPSAFKSLFQRIKVKIGKDSIVNKSSHGYYLR